MDFQDHITQRHQGQTFAMTNPILQNLERYWQTLRDAQHLPARSDIAPRQIDQALPNAFILQRVAPGIGRFRVAGQKLHELLKMDARGMPLGTLFLPQARDQVHDLVEAAFSGPAIVSIPLVSPGSLLRAQVNGTMLLLPMRDSADQPTRILGALVSDAQSNNRPHRFMIAEGAGIRHEPLADKTSATQMMHRAPRLTEKPDAIRPALRLVVNNG